MQLSLSPKGFFGRAPALKPGKEDKPTIAPQTPVGGLRIAGQTNLLVTCSFYFCEEGV